MQASIKIQQAQKPHQTDHWLILPTTIRNQMHCSVGIECAIIDQVIAWIEENQNVMLTRLKEQLIAEKTPIFKKIPKLKRVLQNNNHSE